MRRLLLSATAVVAVLGIAACGDDDDDDSGGGTATTVPAGTGGGATTAPAGTGDAGGEAPAEATITITEFAFPPETRLAAGGTLTVVNETGTAHTVTDALGTFNEEVGAGETIEIPIAEPGSYEFFCNFHPSMMGVINVE
jgi:plastocyanin